MICSPLEPVVVEVEPPLPEPGASTRLTTTFEPEPEIDLNEVAAEIRKLQAEIKDIDVQLKPYFDELGLDFPFGEEGK